MATLKQNQQIVYDAAKACGLNDTQAKIIVAQATHESANFLSNVFKTDNNAFGMKMPSVRPRTYIQRASNIVMKSEGSTPYAHYSSLSDCIKDLILGWHKNFKTDWSKIQTPEQYASYLKSKGYYGDTLTNYTNALKRFFVSVGGMTGGAPIALFLAVGLIAFFYLKNK